MKMINCLVADDEEIARNIIVTYINQISKLNLAGVYTSGTEVYNALQSADIDLIFLDIQMPRLTGIEMLRSLERSPAVILTTAYKEFAMEGYELNVIDYLLKPISFERFLRSVEKYETLTSPKRQQDHIGIMQQDVNGFIYVKSNKKMVRIVLNEILYIEGLKDYVKIVLQGSQVVTYQSLNYFEETLPASHFLRIHRSFIISLNHIIAYSASQVDIGQKEIPIGNTYAEKAMKRLQE